MSDLDTFLSTPIVESLDPERTAKLISAPPFVLIPGVANVRDIGGWPARISNPDGTPLIVRKGRLYRAANLNHITPDGKEALHSLGVGAVFDMRTLHEVRKYAGVSPDDLDPEAGFVDLNTEGRVEKDGIHIYHVPLVDSSKSDPKLEFAKLLQRFGNGDEGFLEDYEELLESGGQSFGSILRYIIEQTKEGSAGKACLWHCHVGKDRTGIFAALVLELLEVPDEDIVRDYTLTRAGLEPARLALLEQFKDLVASHPDVANALASSPASMMIKFLALLRTKYGGARGYFKTHAGLVDEDLDLLRTSLLVEGTKEN